MLYKRSSFITWLTDVCHCNVYPLPNNPKVLVIQYLQAKTFMGVDPSDAIDYEEIYIHYNKLLLPQLPSPKDDLIKIS